VTALVAKSPDFRCIVITSDLKTTYQLRAQDAGARGYLAKHASAAEIERAIEAVAGGFTHFQAEVTVAMDKRAALRRNLTARECELLPYIANFMSAKEISRELTHRNPASPISDRTIEVHRGHIRRKFGLELPGSLERFAMEYCEDEGIDIKTFSLQTRKSLWK
jgi:DNA-binding NarL/FixJ family response regulator